MLSMTIFCFILLGVKSALEHAPEDLGHLVVMGTPAEEGGGGKILMLEEGCFDKVDFSMMVHPAPFDAIYSQSLAVQNVYVTFNGRASHAAAFPWEGVNALDAAVLSYNAISMLRQQIKPTWRAHGVFTNGGIEPAIIPEKAQLHYNFRAPSLKELEEFRTKAENCFRAAAEATGEAALFTITCDLAIYHHLQLFCYKQAPNRQKI
jgi:metal-dependent amidase/aminoacylase/carboxypeptidase family protein